MKKEKQNYKSMYDALNKFEEMKQAAETYYHTVGEIFCPYLKKNVNFNIKGLDHIKMKEWNKARTVADQYVRLKLLKLAPLVLQNSHTLQESVEKKCFERQKINSRWEKRVVNVRYYGFVAIINRARVKVIIKEIEGGRPHFWSIIPFWKQHKNPITNEIKKIFCEGDLENQ
ncbi:MAG: hypothetical protein C0412_13890 [Flavobacterium sp.]|nr:hypothetical protein [Flavobacterium sp.]